MSPSGTRALVELLTSLFTTDELYRFAAFFPGNLRAVLPGGNASLQTVAFELVDTLERRGHIDEALFARLAEERPGRRDEITWVRAQVLDANAPLAAAPRPAVEAVPSVDLAAHATRRSPDLIDSPASAAGTSTSSDARTFSASSTSGCGAGRAAGSC